MTGMRAAFRQRRRSVLLSARAALFALVVGSCDSPTDPGGADVASVHVSPETATVELHNSAGDILDQIAQWSPDDRAGYQQFMSTTQAIFQKGFVELADKYADLGPLYAPTEKLREMAKTGKKFFG